MEQLLQRLGADVGALAVDLGLLTGLQLHVDAGETGGQMNEVGGNALGGQAVLMALPVNPATKPSATFSWPSSRSTQDTLMPLPPELHILADGAVHLAQGQRIHAHHVVQRGIDVTVYIITLLPP